jgi:gliding motility-associated-like protein
MKQLYKVFAIVISLFLYANTGFAQTTSITQLTNGIAPSPLLAGATDKAIIGFALKKTGSGTPNFTAINVQISTTSAGKLTNFKLYQSTDDDYSTNADNTDLSATITVSATQLAISGVSIPLTNSNKNFFVVCDVDASVTSATVAIRPSFTQANLTVSQGTKNNQTVTGTNYSFDAFTAAGNCGPDVPFFTVNLTGNPDSLWISPNIRREPICCGYNPGPPDNDRCVSFLLTLDEDAAGIVFDIHSGAEPSGALGWSIDCGTLNPVGEPICLSDPGPHFITFCKPGSNKNEYSIRSIPKPTVTPPVTVSNGCNTVLTVTDVVPSSVTWTSVPFNATHNSYLSCTSGCTSTTATYQAGAPDSVLYAVQGTPLGGCSSSVFRDTTWVYFVNDKVVTIPNGVICFGGSNTTLTAISSGGKPPYSFLWNTGATTQSITAGVGTYSVTVTDASGCPPGFATAEVTANPSPVTVNAGPDITVCRNNTATPCNGSVVVATGGIWTTSGTGTFVNQNNLVTTYNPSAADLTAGSVTLTLTSVGHEPCPPVSDSFVVTFTDAPVVNAGPNQSLCSNNPVIQLAGTVTNAGGGRWSGGAGTFFANDSVLTATYTPTATEITNGFVILTLTSIRNGTCLAVQDTTRFSFYPAPILNALTNQTVCGNNAVTSITATGSNLTGATLAWTTSGSGSFSPNNALTTSYTPSAADITAGTVTLTLTASRNGCNPVTRTMTLTIQPAPTSNPGNNRTACRNNPQVCLNGTVTNHTSFQWTTSGTGNFTNGTTLTPCYNPSAADLTAGTVNICLRASRAGCTDVTNCLTITYTNSPTIDAGTSSPICANNAVVSLSGSGLTVATGVQWSGGGGTFSAPTSLNTNYTASATERSNAPTSVMLYLTTTGNGSCASVRDSVSVSITPAPIVNAGTDVIVCANSPLANISGTATLSGNTITALWTSPSGGTFGNANNLTTTYTPTASDISAGSVTLTLTSVGHGNCNPVSDQMIITIAPAPTVDAGANQTVCANNATTCLSGSATNHTSVLWTIVSGTGSLANATTLTPCYTPSAADTVAKTVTLRLTASRTGCTSVSDDVIINITPAPVINPGTYNPMCSNNAVIQLNATVRHATGVTWQAGGGSFSPSNSVLNPTYTATATEITNGQVFFQITSTGNGNCSPVNRVFSVSIFPRPTVNVGNDLSICKNNNTVNVTGVVTDVTGGSMPTTNTWTTSGSGTFSSINTTVATSGGVRTTTTTAVYTPSATDLTNGSVVLTMTANTSGAIVCNPIPDQLTVTFTNPPVVNAGPDQSVCANNAVTNLIGTVTIATGGTWTTSGTGNFADANALTTTYTPSNSDITAGTVTLTLTSTGNGNCNPVTDQMVITITPAPTANAGNDISVCANNSTVSLNGSVTVATGGTWTSSGTGTFIPNANQLNAQYIPSPADTVAGTVTLTLTTTGNGNCNAVSDQMVVTITPAPIAYANGPLTSCVNNPSVVLSGSVTRATGGIWTGGAGTYNPNNTSLNATYTPSATEITNGSVILTLTTSGNGNCNAVSNQLTINILPSPIVDAGSDQTLCGTTTTVTMNGTVQNATGGTWTTAGSGTFNDANLLNAVYTPSATDKINGIVTLTLTSTGNGTCNPVTDQMVITFTEVPTVDAGTDMTVCTNDLPIQLNGSGSTSEWLGGTGTFTPNRNVLNPTYMPSAGEISAGSVSLTLQTIQFGACASVSETITITIPQGPVVNAGADFTVCGDISTIAINGTVTNATGGIWSSNGTGTFASATNLSTTYIPSNLDIINGGVRFVLTSTGNGNCTAETDTLFVTITTAPTIYAGPDYTICADQTSINLVATVTVATGGTWSTSNGTGNFGDINSLVTTYSPSLADTSLKTINICIVSTGNGTCQAVTDCMVLNITPAPIVNAGSDLEICADETSVAVSGTVSSAATGGTWTSSGSGTFTPSANTLSSTYVPSQSDKDSGSVILTLSSTGNQNCGAVSDQLTLTITPTPTANAGADFSVCADSSSFAINGTITVATGGTWSTSGTGTFGNANQLSTTYSPSATDIQAGQVTLTLTTTGNGRCQPVTDQVVITITPAPTVSVGNDLEICADDAFIQLNASVTVATGVTWTSSGNGTFTASANILNPVYNVAPEDTVAGQILLIATTTGNGFCRVRKDTLVLTITPKPIVTAGSNLTICADNNSIQLNGSISHAAGGIWSSSGTGSFSPNATDLDAIYTFSNTDKNNGTVTLTLTSTGNGQCNAYSENRVITINPAPLVNAGDDITVCANNTDVALNGNVQFAGGGTWTTSGTGTFANANNLTTTYFPSQTDIDNGGAILTLTSTDNGLCQEVADNLLLTITTAPTITAGGDRDMCADATSITLNGLVTVSTGGTWTTSGSGTFSPGNNFLEVDYSPSTTDKDNGSVVLVLTSTGNGNCLAVIDTINLTINPIPTVTTSDTITVCADLNVVALTGNVIGATGGLWSTNGTGSFTPAANDINASYVPSQADKDNGGALLTLTTTGNGTCNAYTSTTRIVITPAPTVNAGNDITICEGQVANLSGSVTVASGGLWTTGSGTGTFGDPNSLSTTFTPSALQITNGFATITLTTTGNGTCNAVSDLMFVNIQRRATIDAGPNQNVCASQATVQLNGIVTGSSTTGTWTTTGTGTFNNVNSLSAVYTPSNNDKIAGNVKLFLTSTNNGFCEAVIDSMVIGFSPVPTVNLTQENFCASQGNITLNSTRTNATGVVWSSSGTGTFTPPTGSNTVYTTSGTDNTNGSVRIFVTTTGSGSCPAARDSVDIVITPLPIANAGSDQITCANAGPVTLNGTVGGNTTTGEWNSVGGGTFSPNNTTLNAQYTPSALDIQNGQAILYLTTTGVGTCIPAVDTMKIVITPQPQPTISTSSTQLVCADNSATVTASVTIATGVIWTTSGNGTFADPTAFTTQYTPGTTDISSGTVTLTATSTGNGLCNAVSDQMTLTITPPPSINLGDDQEYCNDVETIYISAITTVATGVTWVTTGTGNLNFPNASNTRNITYDFSTDDFNNGTIYFYAQTTGNGTCNTRFDTLAVNLFKQPIVNVTTDALCADADSVQVSGTVQNATHVLWQTLGTGFYAPEDTTLVTYYYPSVTDKTNGSVLLLLNPAGYNPVCPLVRDTILLNIITPPTINAGADKIVCADTAFVPLTGTVANAAGVEWSTLGSGTFSAPTSATSNYFLSNADTTAGEVLLVLTSTGNGLCKAVTDTIKITITDAPVVDAGPAIVCGNNPIVNLEGYIRNAAGAVWSTTGDGIFGNINNLSTTYTLGAADLGSSTVKLYLTTIGNGDCKAKRDSLIINIGDSPFIDAENNKSVCADAGTVSVEVLSFGNATGIIWSSSSNGTFANNTNPTTSYNISQTDVTNGGVMIRVETSGNGNCLPSKDSLFVTITPAPTINANVTTICIDRDTVQLPAATITVATGVSWASAGGGTFITNTSLAPQYIFSTTDQSNGFAELIVTSTNQGTCNAVRDTVLVNLTDPPSAQVMDDITVCATETSISISGTLIGTSTGIWTIASGTGTIQNPNALTTNYLPTAADTAARIVKLVLTTTNVGTCNPNSDTLTIRFDPRPLVSTGGGAMTVCADLATIPLPGSVASNGTSAWTLVNGTGSFAPNTPNGNYIRTADDINAGFVKMYLTATATGTCTNDVVDTLRINITPAPTVDAGNGVICADNTSIAFSASITIASGVTWTSTGTGFFTAPNSLTTSYVPSNDDRIAGLAIIYVTTTGNGTCNAVRDSVQLNITPPPSVDASVITNSFCEQVVDFNISGTVVGATGGIWTTSGNGAFGNNLLLNTTYIPSNDDKTNGEVTLYLTTTGVGNCNPRTDSITVSFEPAPVVEVNAGDDIQVCAEQQSVQLNGSIVNAAGGEWTHDGSGFFDDQFSLTPIYYIHPDDTTAGVVNITLTSTGNGLCDPVIDDLVLSFTSIPVINAGPDTIKICADAPVVTLNGSVSGSGGYWTTGGSGSFANPNSLNTTYTLSSGDISDSLVVLTLFSDSTTGCTQGSRNIVLVIAPTPIVTAVTPFTICADQTSVNLTGFVDNAGGSLWTTSGTGTFNDASIVNATYFPSDADTTARTVTLTLSATDIGSCNPVFANVIINITPAPFIYAGDDFTICADERTISLSPTLMHVTNGTWSTTGTGTFSPSAASVNVTYTVTDADTLSGSVSFTFIPEITTGCMDMSDEIVVTITPTPRVNAGQDQTICADETAVTLNGTITSAATGGIWTTNGSGTFADNTDLTTTYTPSTQDIATGIVSLTLTSTGNGTCNPVSDFMQIVITPAPTIEIGNDLVFCADRSNIQLNAVFTIATGVQWGTTGNGTFTGATSASTSYIPSAADTSAGSIKIYATTSGNGTCNAVSDTINITFTPAPVVSAGSEITVCADATEVQLSGTVSSAVTGFAWTTSGTGQITPSTTTTLNPVYQPTAQDVQLQQISFTLSSTSTVNGCNNVSSISKIIFTPAPTISTSDTVRMCADENAIQVVANITTATGVKWTTAGTGTFAPSDSVLTTNYSPSADEISAGLAFLFATTTGNGTCKAYDAKTVVKIAPTPIVDAGLDKTVCEDNGSIQLNGSVQFAEGAVWTTSGTGVFFINESFLNASYTLSQNDIQAGIVTLRLTSTGNGRCQAVTDSMIINITKKAIVDAGDADACADATGIEVSGTVTNSAGGQWTSSGSGNFAPNAFSLNATYIPSQADINAGSVILTLTSTDVNDCSPVSQSINLIITELPIANGGMSQLVCRGDETTLIGQTFDNLTYSWQTSSGSVISSTNILNITANSDTIFVLEVIDAKGCKSTDTVTVLVNDPPTLNLPSQICYEQGFILDAAPSGEPVLGTFQWFVNGMVVGSANSETLEVNESGTHMILYGFGNCKVIDSTRVTPLPVITATGKIICENASTTLAASSPTAVSYQWTNSSNTVISTNQEATIGGLTSDAVFVIQVTDEFGCKKDTNITVGVLPPPNIELENQPVCIGDVVKLNATPSNISDSTNFTYSWFNQGVGMGLSTSTIEVKEAGVYSVLFAVGECTAKDSSVVTFNAPPLTNADDTIKFCNEQKPTIDINAGDGVSYLWVESGNKDRILTVDKQGTYYVEVYNEFNCKTLDSVFVKNTCPPRVFVPNAFSPNEDGSHDFFRVFGDHYANFKVTIFNRWGEIIYYSEDNNFRWDGTYRGEPQPNGVYQWVLQYSSANPEEYGSTIYKEKGSVTIVR